MPLTMLDIAKLSGNDMVVGLIEENQKSAPEVELFPARTIKGTNYKTVTRIGLPPTGFRDPNTGRPLGKSDFEQKLIETKLVGGPVRVDRGVALAHEDGVEAVQALEASGVAKSALLTIGSQVYYGVTADEKGFPGLKAATIFGSTTSGGDSITIDAGGTTADTASSAYGVVFGEKDVQIILGQGSSLVLDDEWGKQQVEDGDGNTYTALTNDLEGWVGMQIGGENSVRRIANLTEDSGKGMTDSLLAEMIASFPTGTRPNVILMSRRSRLQLQKSRSVVLSGNAKVRPDQPITAPIPTEYDGIPIVATDSILNTDALETA